MSDDLISVSSLHLERRPVAFTMPTSYVDRHAQVVTFQTADSFIRNQMMVSLRSEVLSHRLEDQTDTAFVDVPSSWWQHFKQTAIMWGNPFFDPAKIKRTRLVLMTKFTAWATFPDCPNDYPPSLGIPFVKMSKERVSPSR